MIFKMIKLTHLQDQIVKLLIKKKLLTKLILVNIFGELIDLVSSWTLFQISIGNLNMIYLYVFLDIFTTLFESTFIQKTNNYIANEIRYEFKLNAIRQYSRLSFDSKNKATAETFYQKMLQLSESYFQLISWGIPNFFRLIGSFFKCFVIFCFKGLFYPLLLIIGINFGFYFFCIRDKQKKFTDHMKKDRENRDKIRSLVTISLPMFQQGEKNPEYILELTNTIDNSWLKIEERWDSIMNITKMVNKSGIVVISIFLSDSIPGFLLLINTLRSLNSSISSLTAFLNHNNRYESNYDSYIKFFNKLEYQDAPLQLVLPREIIIDSVNIDHGGFNMRFSPNIKSLSISHGDKILIRGRTGHGKSTFINALMGKIKGIELNIGKPENYHSSFVEMYQNIREKLPTSSISIRKLFDDDESDELIMRCLKPCFPDDDIDRIFSNLRKSHIEKIKSENKDESDIDDSCEDKQMLNREDLDICINPLDIDIAERISGGEKTRLALATRIHQMLVKPNKQILILDEPEQGSDPEVAMRVIGNIFNLFKDKTIIMVSHICECQLDKLGIKWDNKLSIHQGIINLSY